MKQTTLQHHYMLLIRLILNEVEGQYHKTMTMKIDNIYTINLAKTPYVRCKNKHIEMRFPYLMEQVSSGKLCLECCKSEDQVADIMTKAMQIEVFKKIRCVIGVKSLATMNCITCSKSLVSHL